MGTSVSWRQPSLKEKFLTDPEGNFEESAYSAHQTPTEWHPLWIYCAMWGAITWIRGNWSP